MRISDLASDLSKLDAGLQNAGIDPSELAGLHLLIGEVVAAANFGADPQVDVPAARRVEPGARYLVDLAADCHNQLTALINGLHASGVPVAALATLLAGIPLLQSPVGLKPRRSELRQPSRA